MAQTASADTSDDDGPPAGGTKVGPMTYKEILKSYVELLKKLYRDEEEPTE